MFNGTIKEFAKLNDVNENEANGFIKFLVKVGKAKITGKQVSKSGKGKPSIIYEIPNEFTVTIK